MADSQDAADLVSGFSIWAVPGQPVAQELEDVIKTYAQQLATPPFLPHMTVLSGVKVPVLSNWNNADALLLANWCAFMAL